MIYAVCNPTAGNGRGRKIGLRVYALLQKRGQECALRFTESPGHATSLAREAWAAGAALVLAVGGDGTALEVAQGMLGSDVHLGIIPAGTGNDFVKTLGIPLQPEKALDHVLRCAARKTDVGEVNGRLFLNEIGTGFDVSVLDYAAKAKKYCRGLLPYLYGVVRTLFRFRSVPITFSVDGGESVTEDAFVVGVANGGMIGGGIPIAPGARADDGLLEVVVVKKIVPGRLIGRLIGLMKGNILSFPETLYFQAASVRFSAPGMRLNVDGEIRDIKDASARVIPGALMIRR